jgi:hypothetical protein
MRAFPFVAYLPAGSSGFQGRSVPQLSASWRLTLTETEISSIVPGVFTPVLAKHSKSLSLIDSLAVAVDRMQRNSEPFRPRTI